MPEFLLELYVSRAAVASAGAGAKRARLAAEELDDEGTAIRYLSSILVPEDETCFYLYEAGSADAVHEAARRAGLQYERISEAVAEPHREETFPWSQRRC
jgi:Protein of unknown function (DUF4242)